ncbi:MAG: hypothetical protein QM743_13360 [Chitinophagaceae bacterium]
MEYIRTFNENNNSVLKKGQFVRYKMEGYKNDLSTGEQEDKIGHKEINRIEGNTVFFKDNDGNTFSKLRSDILPDDLNKERKKKKSDVKSELKQKLGQIKNDEEKMNKVLNFVNFLQKG